VRIAFRNVICKTTIRDTFKVVVYLCAP
jgi:hypothetical protein